jgi:glutathione S-transferase
LGDKSYLDGARFTAGDLMMATVLRILPDLVVDQRLAAYIERCTGRPPFKRALEAQMGDFEQAA